MGFRELYESIRTDPNVNQCLEKRLQELSKNPLPKWGKDVFWIEPQEYCQKIYRITAVEHLIESLENHTSYFGSPWDWEATDSIFVRSSLRDKATGTLVGQTYMYDYFCQCWQMSGDISAMWARFSKPTAVGYRAVMVETTLKQYIESIYEEDKAQIFCGRVQYLDRDVLLNPDIFYCKGDGEILLFANSGAGLRTTLFLKWDKFVNENEIRFCIQNPDKGSEVKKAVEGFTKISGIHYPHKTKYKDLISRVILDPRICDEQRATIQTKLESLGVQAVEKSQILATLTLDGPLSPPTTLSYNVDFGLP